MVDRALLFRALHAHFVGFYVLCFVGKVYPWPRIGLLSLGEAVWDEPAQYISMWAPETTRVVPNRESLLASCFVCGAWCTIACIHVYNLPPPTKVGERSTYMHTSSNTT